MAVREARCATSSTAASGPAPCRGTLPSRKPGPRPKGLSTWDLNAALTLCQAHHVGLSGELPASSRVVTCSRPPRDDRPMVAISEWM
jgi:hypothetical protein